MVKTPVYTAFFLDKESPAVPGFSEVTMAKFKILLPTALVKGDSPKWRRIAIVDDSITTGWSMKALTDYLCRAGYKRANIKTACCVCYQGVKVVHGEQPDISPFRASMSRYRMPWGYAYSFESCFEVSSGTSPAEG
ncbi:MAG TPA: phosphoribosyltransferase [Terriglobales bacterium]|nr:phosphoribosyltransferase [Terriglobales bacterium]